MQFCDVMCLIISKPQYPRTGKGCVAGQPLYVKQKFQKSNLLRVILLHGTANQLHNCRVSYRSSAGNTTTERTPEVFRVHTLRSIIYRFPVGKIFEAREVLVNG